MNRIVLRRIIFQFGSPRCSDPGLFFGIRRSTAKITLVCGAFESRYRSYRVLLYFSRRGCHDSRYQSSQLRLHVQVRGDRFLCAKLGQLRTVLSLAFWL